MRESFVDICVSAVSEAARRAFGGPVDAVELFAGNGHLYTALLARHCRSVLGCDVEPRHQAAFERNVCGGTFVCRDSVQWLEALDIGVNTWHIVSVDNPLGIFGPRPYCEHFDVVPHLHKIVRPKSVVALNIVRKPYSYDIHPEWQQRRADFYGRPSAELRADWTVKYYETLLARQGLQVHSPRLVCREVDDGRDYFHMFVATVERCG